jgi:hypothetical protein
MRNNGDLRRADLERQTRTKIRSRGEAILRTALACLALLAAFLSPVAWYWKIAIALLAIYAIGLVVTLIF